MGFDINQPTPQKKLTGLLQILWIKKKDFFIHKIWRSPASFFFFFGVIDLYENP